MSESRRFTCVGMALLLLTLALAAPALAQNGKALTTAPAVVGSIRFEGATYFRPQTLKAMVGQREGQVVDARVLENDVQRIAKKYRERGFFKVHVAVEQRWRMGQVDVVFVIKPGKRARVRQVLVHGNTQLSDAEVIEGMFTQPDGFFAAFKQHGIFHVGRLDRDKQAILHNYYRRGYLEAKVTGWKALALPESDAVDVRLFVEEGPLYRMGEISFVGDLPRDVEDLRQRFALHRGDIADLITMRESLDRMLDAWRERGYPFPSASQDPVLDSQRHLLSVQFTLQRGLAARVSAIEIAGEPWTRREVILRDLKIKVGDLYSRSKRLESQAALLATGLFTKVDIEPRRGVDDTEVELHIKLTERPGIIKDCIFNIAPAFLQYEGFIGIGLLMCPNFMGRGQRFSAIGQLSSLRQLFDFSWSEPRLLGSHLGLSTGLHRRKLVYPNFDSNYLGLDTTLSAPLGWDLRGSLGYSLDQVVVDPRGDLVRFAGTPRFPMGLRRSLVLLRLSHDTRRGGLSTTGGSLHSLSVRSGGFWTLSEISLIELRAQARYYIPLVFDALLKINVEAAAIADPTGQPVPVSERYFAGGYGSVRGYLPRSLGPTTRLGDASDAAGTPRELALGGTREALLNLELELPLIPKIDLKGFVFLDAGNTFDDDENFMLLGAWETGREVPLPLGMYSSVGFGLLLPTGTMPIRLEWSVPLTRRQGDRQVDFFFGVGGML